MATSYNSTIKLYSGVPLVKGGTEVLYLSQGAAEGVLSAFLKATYDSYYFVRENRQAVQIDAPFGDCDDVNYISFSNKSHGGKIYFGFVDQVVYVNDNCTQIEFTIDPFPTFLGDTTEREDVFLIRNTVKSDSLNYIADDFDFEGEKLDYISLTKLELSLSKALTIFTGGRLVNDDGALVADTSTIAGTIPVNLYGHQTGIQAKVGMTDADVRTINQAGGSIIGVYAVDAGFDVSNLTSQEIAGAVIFTTVRHLKLNTGQYNKIILNACGQSKVYDLNMFSSSPRIAFEVRRIIAPIPYIAIIPKDYKGLAENTSEALIVEYPSLAFSVGNTSNFASVVNTAFDSFNNMMGKTTTFNDVAASNRLGDPGHGMNISQLGNWIFHPVLTAGTAITRGAGYAGAAMAALPDVISNAGRAIGTARKGTKLAEIASSTGSLVLTNGNRLGIEITLARHTAADIEFLDKYFDYYGYALNRFAEPNTDDKAFLQTGSEMLSGSEADVVLNNYLSRGVKIRKTLP